MLPPCRVIGRIRLGIPAGKRSGGAAAPDDPNVNDRFEPPQIKKGVPGRTARIEKENQECEPRAGINLDILLD
jgi:hypothetical protein